MNLHLLTNRFPAENTISRLSVHDAAGDGILEVQGVRILESEVRSQDASAVAT